MYLRRCYALFVEDGTFSHKIDYVTIYLDNLNLKGHPNGINGSKVYKITQICMVKNNPHHQMDPVFEKVGFVFSFVMRSTKGKPQE